jgi:hypothetical protein
MALADFQQLVMDLVSDQDKAVTPGVRDRAIEQARVRYSADMAAAHVLDADNDTIALEHRLPVAQYAAHLLCQQLAARYSGERETATGADVARTESRARNYAARAKEYRAAYYQGTGQADPFAPAGAPAGGQAAAAAVVSWPGRRRHQLTRGAL